jgi:hypothetical protein
MPLELLTAILLLLAGFAIRLLPSFTYTRDPTDAAAQAHFAQQIAAEGKPPRWIDRVVPRTEGSYPAGIAIWMAVTRPKDPVRSCSLLNVVVQLVEACAAVSCGEVAGRTLGLGPWELAPWVAAVYVAPPLTFLPWSGVYSVTARPIGALCSNVILLALLFGAAIDWRWGLLAVIVLPVSIGFSQFASQGVAIGCVALALALPSWQPLAFTAAGVALAVVATWGYLWRVIVGHAAHSSYYARVLQYQHVGTTHRFENRRRALAALLALRLPRPDILVQDPFLRAATVFPVFPFALASPLLITGLLQEPVWRGLWSLCAVSAIAVPVFSFRHLRFLGEPDRYIMFCGTMASAVLTARWAAEDPAAAIIVVVTSTASLGLSIAVIWSQSGRRAPQGASGEAVGRVLDSLGDRGSVLVNPSNASYRLMPCCGRTFLTLFMNVPRDREGQEVLARLYDGGYPFVGVPASRLAESFGVSTVVEVKRYFTESYSTRHGAEHQRVCSGMTPVYEDEEVAVYDIRPSPPGDEKPCGTGSTQGH